MTHCGGWEAVRSAVRLAVGVPAYKAWFGRLEGHLDGETLVLNCPDRFTRDYIEGRYGDALARASERVRRVEYRVEESPVATVRASVPPRRARSAAHGDPSASGGRSHGHRSASGRQTHGASVSRPADAVRAGEARPPRGEQLDFDSFVVGDGNALALEAARAVALGRAGRCTPLFLAGRSGLGKTHLCRAILAARADQAVYRSAEEFTTEVTGAMRGGRMHEIRHRYRRSANLLILEDVQFLSGKRATQVELFHTLDHLLSRGRTVVLSADCAPGELADLDPNLRSRMGSGLVARITPPGGDTRRSILREKASRGGVRLPDACLELLAERPVESVRDLLAGLNQVVARAALLRQPIAPGLVAQALAAVEVPTRARTLDEIRAEVARAYGVTEAELRGRSRKRHVVRPRQVAMYLCRRCTDASLKEIGRAFSRDHTSVMYAVDVVERRSVEQPPLRYELEALAARLSVR